MWVQASYKVCLYSALAVILITLTGVSLSVSIETERERLERWLLESAQLLAKNEFTELKQRVHPGASSELRSLEAYAQNLEFRMVSVKRIHEIIVSGKGEDKKAILKFNILAEVAIGGNIQKFPRYVELTLYDVDGRWLVSDVRMKNRCTDSKSTTTKLSRIQTQ